ncbi:unnamed protein product [Boreogadus saida]
MRAVSSKQGSAGGSSSAAATEKQNGGDMKRRPSYPGDQRVKHANLSTKIWVKVAMAIAYFLCVSVAAFILVIYYVFFWTPDAHYNITGNGMDPPNRTDCAPSTVLCFHSGAARDEPPAQLVIGCLLSERALLSWQFSTAASSSPRAKSQLFNGRESILVNGYGTGGEAAYLFATLSAKDMA